MEFEQAAQALEELSREEISRYSRHLLLPEVGQVGQQRLKNASVLIIGTGGLGCPISLYLAAAGVGHISLIDFDRIEPSNLQRQILFGEEDCGKRKVEVAARQISRLNKHIEIEIHDQRFTAQNALDLTKNHDIIVDGTDNFPTRYLANDAAYLAGKPYVYGSIFRFDGQVSVFHRDRGPCYRCLFPAAPPPGVVPNCAEGGVLGILPGQVGTLQATEVLKLVLNIGQPLFGKLLLYDALEMSFQNLKIRQDPDCRLCSANADIVDLSFHTTDKESCQFDSVQLISPKELHDLLTNDTPPRLIDVRQPSEVAIVSLKNSELVPLQQLEKLTGPLGPLDQPIVVYCKGGNRSQSAALLLGKLGHTNVRSLAGGINRWVTDIDSSLPTY